MATPQRIIVGDLGEEFRPVRFREINGESLVPEKWKNRQTFGVADAASCYYTPLFSRPSPAESGCGETD